MSTPAAIQEAVRRIAEGFHPRAIILFGSHARGTAMDRSDIDLLVLVDQTTDLGTLTSKMYAAMKGLGSPVDIVVMPHAEFELHKDYVGTVARPAAREGRVLYQRVA